jgi:lipid A 3-O-deacylase
VRISIAVGKERSGILRRVTLEFALALFLLTVVAAAQSVSNSAAAAARTMAKTNLVQQEGRPWDFGVLVQGGFGITQSRGNFKFMMAGVHAGKVLTPNLGKGLLRGNFEYSVEVFPFWQSYTPTSLRQNCVPFIGPFGVQQASCSAPFTIGGTFTGVSITPALFRWNFAGTPRWTPWIQGGGGVIWTNHKYPAFGGPPVSTGGISNSSLGDNAANDDASVWNFTPQFGVGAHYFISSNRSIDFGANAIHISSASLGDKNPGVNASVQFTLGYSWWKK